MLARQLSAWGLNCVVAATADEAIAVAGHQLFDVTIVSMEVPGATDGVELHNRLASSRVGDTASAITMLPGRRDARIETSGAQLLSKPFGLADLHRAITPAPQTAAAPSAEGADDPPTGLSILLVDDNAVNQKVGSAILKKLGFDADIAADGVEAVRRVTEAVEAGRPYALVFMDVQMPEMDGVEATMEIRRSIGVAVQPWIVALTANALDGDRERYLEAGMDDYLSKPVQLDGIREAILGVPRTHASRTG